MSVRRLHHDQPENFEFTSENSAWAREQIAKYPEGRQASAVIALLWRAQEQHEGWLPEPAIRFVADMLSMPYIRVLEVATFYTMFQLQPVGRKAHIQVCGTTPCMLSGSGKIKEICRNRIAENPHQLSTDGQFSWEEVECLGACVNAPMVQIWKDTYEDLTPESFEALLDAIADGKPVTPGPQNGRHFSVPEGGATSLKEGVIDYCEPGVAPVAAIIDGATRACDVVASRSINGGEAVIGKTDGKGLKTKNSPKNSMPKAIVKQSKSKSANSAAEKSAIVPDQIDDLKKIKGIGPKMAETLNNLGIMSYAQIASWKSKDIVNIEEQIRSKGRIAREQWIKQAKALLKQSRDEA